MPEDKNRILVGQMIGAHGIKGEVRVKTFTQDPDAVAAYGPLEDESGGTRYSLRLRSHKDGVAVVAIKGVASRTEAEALAKARVRLYAPRAALPPAGKGRFYFADLVGLVALDENGAAAGRVLGAYNFGAGDVIELAREDGKRFMLPLQEPFAHSISLKKGTLQVTIPEGWLENTKEKSAPVKKKRT